MCIIFITQTIQENTIAMSAHDQNHNLISVHSVCINNDLISAILLTLIKVMCDLSAGNNIKLMDFDPTVLNMLMYDYKRWRRSKWTSPDTDIRHMELWETWPRVKRYNRIYPQYS